MTVLSNVDGENGEDPEFLEKENESILFHLHKVQEELEEQVLKNGEITRDLNRTQIELKSTRRELSEARNSVVAYTQSISWRMTVPLRKLFDLVQQIRK